MKKGALPYHSEAHERITTPRETSVMVLVPWRESLLTDLALKLHNLEVPRLKLGPLVKYFD